MIWKKKKDAANQSAGEASEAKTSSGAAAFAKKNWKWLAKIFAVFGVMVGLLGIGTFSQINGITSAVNNFFDANNAWTVQLFGRDYSWTVVIAGIILTIFVAFVIIGGLRRISAVAQVVVPFMAVAYIIAAVLILILNYKACLLYTSDAADEL